ERGVALQLPTLADSTSHALQCYTCLEPMSASLCMTISNCSTNDIVCKTVMYSLEEVFPFVGDSTVVKGCAQKCIPSDVDEIGGSRPTFCCNSDLCNVDGAVRGTHCSVLMHLPSESQGKV
uniref:LY6/PLAUR domain containing 2 n=1 Tax=Chrysemys picta bellii TaxID=8478 RepID=A0A8C3I315_CHRPI